MKKTMLFFITLFFSISASAATLNLTTAGSSGASQEVSLTNNDIVLADGTVDEPNTNWSSLFDLSTNQDTPVKVVWSFNPEANLSSATVSLFENGSGAILDLANITSDYTFNTMLMAGVSYGLDILGASSDELKYDVSVSAVPIPAALFLFGPALLGLLGMRLRAKSNA
jgi:hypothetical protein